MATAEQIKGLIKSYADCDNERFKTIALQIAAHEAKMGHDNLAREIKKQIDRVGSRRTNIVQMNSINPMLQLSMPSHFLSELIVSEDIKNQIQRVLTEYRNKNKLISYGLKNRRKILIEGNPGTGKTLTAAIIASELSLPLYTVQMDKLVTKYMGETSAKLRQIFDSISSTIGVYLFDEFDAIGADRSLDNEVGEMRRILNSFLQFLEQDESESVIIAATNNKRILDPALFRRFDDVLHYQLPSHEEIKRLFEHIINAYDESFVITEKIIRTADGLNHAEIVRVCDDAIKKSILSDEPITCEVLIALLNERQKVYTYKEA